MTIPSESFIGMSCSLTQAQRAIVRCREEYLPKLVALVKNMKSKEVWSFICIQII